jgi:hypothetical protein
MSSLLVAHLVRREEGLVAFTRFLASYRRHPAGREHGLVLLCKGFAAGSVAEWAPYQEHLGELAYLRVTVPEEGFDLGAYRAFLPTAAGCTVLFLNSHAEVLVDGWLDLLARHSGPGRLVGATGSWNSHRRDRFTEVPPWHRPRRPFLSRVRRASLAFRDAWQDEVTYPVFPNPHIRTNAFLLPPDLHYVVTAWPVPRDKAACYALESGNAGLSRTVIGAGGALIVAGADGQAHTPGAWPRAGIFLSGRQQHLLIADNHTRAYAAADVASRRLLGWYTWRAFHVLAEP